MPELPEVEFTARQLRATILGAVIRDVRIFWERAIGRPDPAVFRTLLTGQRILQVRRRGKYVLLDLGREPETVPELLMTVHRRMTGNLYLLPPGWEIDESARTENPLVWQTRGPVFIPRVLASTGQQGAALVRETEMVYYDATELSHCRVCFDLADGRRLLFNDSRKFGRLEVWPAESEDEALAGLGPEPLSPTFTVEILAERLAGRKGALKTVLLAQETVVGLGNIYADEALFVARLHPLRSADSLTALELQRLHAAIVAVLTLGIEHGGTTFSGYRGLRGELGAHYEHLQAYHRAGEIRFCARCGGRIVSQVIAQRTAHFCPTCQPLSGE